MIERKIFGFIGNSIKYLNSSVGILKKNRSPNIAHVQQHFDLFDNHKKIQSSLQKSGYLNTHLCLNAETDRKHTECDSSYTVISVPAHSKEKTTGGISNKGVFEFNISHVQTLLLPLDVGTVLVYSGYLLTHRQQIKLKNENHKPFINAVAYNSEKLFNRLMESLRREINESPNKK